MQLHDYVQVIRARWWAILIAALAAAVVAYGISKLQTSIFRAEASYLIEPSRNDNGLNIVLVNTMNSYRELVLSRPRLEQASSELQLDLSADQLRDDVYVQPQPDQRKIVIQVDNSDPALAASLANKLGAILQAEIARSNESKEGSDKISATLLDPAVPPSARHSPNTKINVLAGAILGGIFGLLLAFGLYFLDDTLKTSADIERFVGLTTLGTIPALDTAAVQLRRSALQPRWLARALSRQ